MARERVTLAIITVLTALLGTFLSSLLFMSPVPLAILVFRHGLRPGIVTALSTGIIVAVSAQHPMAMLLVLLVLGLGVAIGEALRDDFSLGQTLVVAWAASLLTFVVLYLVSYYVLGIDMVEVTVQMWLEQLMRLAGEPTGMFTDADLAKLAAELRTMLPGMTILASVGIATFDYWLIGRWLIRLGSAVPWFPPLEQWRFPWFFAWGYIAGLGLPLLNDLIRWPWLMPLAINLEVVFRFVFLVQGVAVLWFFLRKWRVRRFKTVLMITLAILAPRLLVFVGLLDSWFDLRRIDRL